MRHAFLAILCSAVLGSPSCSSSGSRGSYAAPALTAGQVKVVAKAAAAMRLPTEVLDDTSDPIMKTKIGDLVPDLSARTQGAGIGDLLPNEQQKLAIWDFHYWLNNNSTLIVTAEQMRRGFVITNVVVKRRLFH